MELIYISSAITQGDKNYNYYIASAVHMALLRNGYAVVNPMSTMTMPEAVNVDWETWLRCDEEIISRCDMVLRLPHGESVGRERECDFATTQGIPVVDPGYFECLRTLYQEVSA